MGAVKAWFLTNFVWIKIWPLAREIFLAVSDGKITREEVKVAVDKVFNGKEEIKLW